MKAKTWEGLGHVGVDSGTLWIGDPCYLSGGKGPMQNWSSFCEQINSKVSAVFPEGTMVGGFGGDGCFPVVIRRNKQGVVVEVRIRFAR